MWYVNMLGYQQLTQQNITFILTMWYVNEEVRTDVFNKIRLLY